MAASDPVGVRCLRILGHNPWPHEVAGAWASSREGGRGRESIDDEAARWTEEGGGWIGAIEPVRGLASSCLLRASWSSQTVGALRLVPREPPHAGAVAARRRSAAATSLAERSKGGGGATDAGAPLPLGWAGGQKGAMGAGMVRKGRELVVVSREA
eukprot:scaffold116175_cov28-Tisochrysis_lutea.AAC.5